MEDPLLLKIAQLYKNLPSYVKVYNGPLLLSTSKADGLWHAQSDTPDDKGDYYCACGNLSEGSSVLVLNSVLSQPNNWGPCLADGQALEPKNKIFKAFGDLAFLLEEVSLLTELKEWKELSFEKLLAGINRLNSFGRFTPHALSALTIHKRFDDDLFRITDSPTGDLSDPYLTKLSDGLLERLLSEFYDETINWLAGSASSIPSVSAQSVFMNVDPTFFFKRSEESVPFNVGPGLSADERKNLLQEHIENYTKLTILAHVLNRSSVLDELFSVYYVSDSLLPLFEHFNYKPLFVFNSKEPMGRSDMAFFDKLARMYQEKIHLQRDYVPPGSRASLPEPTVLVQKVLNPAWASYQAASK